MADTNEIVHQHKRILYVEPNDIYGYVKERGNENETGIAMTPDYSDYCISFNLIAEVVSRQKESGQNSTKQFVITWTTPVFSENEQNGGQQPYRWISFLQGEDAEKFGARYGANDRHDNLLTTYYTDINYDDIVKNNVVEGIGIESIQVSFESYYTPTVIIKFVDVRGAALFGREEAVHQSGEDLTTSSIFGAFFTIPYPKFKLQIKGFYGHGVTYQLTCSKFNASFNSQTGNFEAVATFIGYSYSLLTDIPLRYLVCAPYCHYVGKDYWNSRLHSDDWRLSDGSTPQTLADIIQKIRDLTAGEEDLKQKLMSDDDASTKNSISNQKQLLSELSTALKNYVDAIRSLNQTSQSVEVSGENEEQIIVFSHTSKIDHVGETVAEASRTLNKAFTDYNNAVADNPFDLSILPDGFHELRNTNSLDFSLLCKKIDKNASTGNITNVVFNVPSGNSQSVSGIMNIELNDKVKPSKEMSEKLYKDAFEAPNNNIPSYFGEYGYILNLHFFQNEITKRMNDLNDKDKEIDKKIESAMQDAAADMFKFKPYIGDIFKIIMCHLETFIHMMWECYHVIDGQAKNGQREPSYLGVNLSNTDIVIPEDKSGKNYIYPWPGVFNNGKLTNEGGDIDDSMETIAWIGDYGEEYEDKWEEVKLVKELYKASQRVGKQINSEPQPITLLTGLPIMPNDFNDGNSIFAPSIKNDISGITGYLSFRAAQIFGILMNEDASTELARTLGAMDAYNYYSWSRSKEDINNTLIEPTANNGSLGQVMMHVARCENGEEGYYAKTVEGTDQGKHSFETVLRIQYMLNEKKKTVNRHPMYVADGSKSKYVHYYMNNYTAMVPDRMKDYISYKDTFRTYEPVTNPHFMFLRKNTDNNMTNTNGFVHKSSTKILYEGIDSSIKSSYVQKEYINNDMFDVLTDSKYADAVTEKYKELSNGSFTIDGEEYKENLSSVLNKFWHVKNEDYGKYFGDNMYMLSRKTSERGITEDELYPDENKANENGALKRPSKLYNSKIFETKGEAIRYKSDTDGWTDESGNVKQMGNLCVRFIQSNYYNGNTNSYENLFATPFYYEQNRNETKYNGETNGQMKERHRNVKALIFLHALKYDYKQLSGFLNPDKKDGGIYMIPYGYLLLLGGLLWREKFRLEHGSDPIQSGHGFKGISNSGTLTTLFREINSQYRLCPLKDGDNAAYGIYPSQLFGMGKRKDGWMPDEYVTNCLIKLFTDFTGSGTGMWTTLMSGMELRRPSYESDKTTLGKEFSDGKQFIDDTSDFFGNTRKSYYYSYHNNTTNYFSRIRNHADFSNFLTNYKYVTSGFNGTSAPTSNDKHFMMLLNDNVTEVQDILKDIYTRKVIVLDTSGIRHVYNTEGNGKEIEINTSTLLSYFDGFEGKLKDIVSTSSKSEGYSYNPSDDGEKPNKDFLLPIYMYCKMIWDKWLVSTTTKKDRHGTIVKYEDYYNVENFFKSFIFIDAFYKNIYKKFMINLESLKDSYFGRDEDGSLFQFIGDITKGHNCLFLALPDYVDMGNEDSSTAVNTLKDVFRPIPYVEMNDMDDENKFVIIYTPRQSEVPSELNGFKSDYFKVWNPATNSFDQDGEKFFSLGPVNDESEELDADSRYGYYVPSFGVAFSKQNNHLFKNISLDMSTPLVTSASINALSNIAKQGSGGMHKIAFVGQDIYPVYSNYSYICEIEMMGDAQIQPLMYFQLMNIPMWSGVYMIFNVTHTITPGNMTTKFKGMKLSRNPLPYNSSWFMFRPDYSDDVSEGSGGGGSAVIGDLPSSYDKVTEPKKDHFHDPQNRNKVSHLDSVTNSDGSVVNVDSNLVHLFNCLYEEIELLPENQGSSDKKWNVCLVDVVRAKGVGKNSKSDHLKGHAMDLHVKYKNGTYMSSGTNQKQLYTALDILYCNHRNEVRQVLAEYVNTSNSDAATYMSSHPYGLHCLHVATVYNSNDKHEFIIHNQSKNAIINSNHDMKWFIDNAPTEFKGTASRHYNSSKATLKKWFPNFMSSTEEQLEALFGNSVQSGNAFDQWFKWSNSWEGGYGGITGNAIKQYKIDGGTSSNPSARDIALTSFWNANHLNQIKDASVAILSMYSLFWHGNGQCVANVAHNRNYSSSSSSPYRLKESDINILNNMPPKAAFNKIKKQIGEYIINPPSYKLPKGGDPRPGWIRRWFSIDYGPSLKMNAEAKSGYSEQDLRNAMAKL